MLKKLVFPILLLYSLLSIVFSMYEDEINVFNYEDLVFTDYNITTLVTTDIPQALSAHYLQKNQLTVQAEPKGRIWGRKSRPLIALPVKLNLKTCVNNITIFFLVDTASPVTTLTKQAAKALYADCKKQYIQNQYSLIINGKKQIVLISQQPSQSVNRIGADFLMENQVQLIMNYTEIGPRELILKFDAFEDEQQDSEL